MQTGEMARGACRVLACAGWLGAPAAASAAPLDSDVFASIAERVTPAVVNITTETLGPSTAPSEQELERQFRDMLGSVAPTGGGDLMRSGSGVLLSRDGYIATNAHLVGGAARIRVGLGDGRELDARLVGADGPSDLALLKIDAKDLPHLSLGDSAAVRAGDVVLAVGNPYGVGQTITMGIVSAKGRANIGIVDYEDFIQTDAAIHPGNSGGALVNLKGELIGICTAMLSGARGPTGLGFAVPIEMARPILDQIRAHGRMRRGWTGLAVQELTSELSLALALPKLTGGALISDVARESPASRAGLLARDVVLRIDGLAIRSAADLRNRLANLPPGAAAALIVRRDERTLKVALTVGEEDGGARVAPPAPRRGITFGLYLETLTAELRRLMSVPDDLRGVVVVGVESGGPGERAGLIEGDVITAVDKSAIESLEALGSRFPAKAGSVGTRPVLLRVFRRGQSLFVALRPG